ncbi:MAG: hypothetical protein ACC707_04305 [Thiohalomonadales bacterium]
MKARYLFLFLFSIAMFFYNVAASAEGISVTPFIGYQYGGSATADEGEVKFADGENKGLSIEFRNTSLTMIQLLYITQDSTVTLQNNVAGEANGLFDLRTEYYHLGGIKEIVNGNAKTFVSGSFGATYFKPNDSRFSDETLFSISLGFGADLAFTKRFSLILQGRALLPFQSGSGGLFCVGGVCKVHMQGSTSLIQYDLTAGLRFTFG